MSTLQELIESEICDFFAGFGSPGEPETPEDMQSQLLARIAPLLASMEQEPVAQVYQPANIGICAPLGPSVMMLKPLSPGTNLYAAPQLPQPAVPEEIDKWQAIDDIRDHDESFRWDSADGYEAGWNACRAAMLQGAEPVSQPYTLRDGWVAVPVEPTAEMQSAAAGAIRFDTTPINKLWTGNAVYKAMLAAAPQQEAK